MFARSPLCLLVGLLLLTVGCNSSTPATNGPTAAGGVDGARTVDSHAHPSEGPHHGSLVELGNEEYHAEILHDKESVTIYILDASAKKTVPIEATETTINVVNAGKPEQFQLKASPEADDPSGKSSRFVIADAELALLLDDASAAPKLNVTIAGTPFRGDIQHDHEHAGHDHAH